MPGKKGTTTKKAATPRAPKPAAAPKSKGATPPKFSLDEKFYYFFGNGKADGNASMRDLLGGKGANLAEMSSIGVPVPPGFTITTSVCKIYYENGMAVPKPLDKELERYVGLIEQSVGRKFGDADHPLLVSVRSGAKFSMPGMMDTILNLGLNDANVEGLSKRTNNPRFALDNYRRFISMFGNVVLGIDKEQFEEIITEKKHERRVKQDSSLQVNDLKDIIKRYKQIIKRKSGETFPDDPMVQLRMARDAVFRSWNNPRAISYRRMNNIPADLGTAVNIQAMVFGNMGNTSGTGVGIYPESLDRRQGILRGVPRERAG